MISDKGSIIAFPVSTHLSLLRLWSNQGTIMNYCCEIAFDIRIFRRRTGCSRRSQEYVKSVVRCGVKVLVIFSAILRIEESGSLEKNRSKASSSAFALFTTELCTSLSLIFLKKFKDLKLSVFIIGNPPMIPSSSVDTVAIDLTQKKNRH